MKPDVLVELKALRLHGMAGVWSDLVEQGGRVAGGSGIESSCWLIEHLLQTEGVDRAMRSVSHQMKAAKFPVHRDMAGFDLEVLPVDCKLVATMATTAFTDDAHNVVQVGGPGTGKTHLCKALGVSGFSRHGKRVRFYSTVDLVGYGDLVPKGTVARILAVSIGFVGILFAGLVAAVGVPGAERDPASPERQKHMNALLRVVRHNRLLWRLVSVPVVFTAAN